MKRDDAGEKPFTPKCMISIDREGEWFHENRPIIHRDILQLFFEHLHRDHWGRYLITWKGQVCEVDVEDAPLVVKRTELRTADNGRQEVAITLSDRRTETLDLSSLRTGENHVLYCSVRQGTLDARFSRPAYYQFAELLEWDEGAGIFRIRLNGEPLDLPQISPPTPD